MYYTIVKLQNFRCIISGPIECGKTFLLRQLIISNIYCDKLIIIGPTGDQYEVLESFNRRSRNSVDSKASIEFIKDIKCLLSPDRLPKDLKKLMMFHDFKTKRPFIKEYFVEVDIIIVM